MTTDNFGFYLQNRLIQTSQTGGQQYSNTSPFSIPCIFCWIVSEELKSLKTLTTDYCRNSRKVSAGWSTGCFCHSCWSRFGSNFVKYIHVWSNGTACTFKNLFHLFEYQHLLLLRDICWSEFKSLFKCCYFSQHQA